MELGHRWNTLTCVRGEKFAHQQTCSNRLISLSVSKGWSQFSITLILNSWNEPTLQSFNFNVEILIIWLGPTQLFPLCLIYNYMQTFMNPWKLPEFLHLLIIKYSQFFISCSYTNATHKWLYMLCFGHNEPPPVLTGKKKSWILQKNFMPCATLLCFF